MGTNTRPAKGHPRMTPAAAATNAWRKCSVNQKPNESITHTIANDDGRNAERGDTVSADTSVALRARVDGYAYL